MHRAKLGITLFAALLAAGCATGGRVPIRDAPGACRELLHRGVFNRETLTCFPEVAAAVDERLCVARFRTHQQANLVGFGYGTTVFLTPLVRPLEQGFKGFSAAAVASWKTRHCAGNLPRIADGNPLRWEQAVAGWGDLYDRLPTSLAGPWLLCMESMQAAPESYFTGAPRCFLDGSFDLSGEDEEIRFTAWSPAEGWFDLGARLTADLEVEGADCSGREWRKGSRISSTRARSLLCRRRGRSAVRIRLATGDGSCERSLPELTAAPWRELCSRDGVSADPATPGRAPAGGP